MIWIVILNLFQNLIYKNKILNRVQDDRVGRDFTGRPMKGFVFINPEGTKTNSDLNYWIILALEYNKTAKASLKRKK